MRFSKYATMIIECTIVDEWPEITLTNVRIQMIREQNTNVEPKICRNSSSKKKEFDRIV